VDLSAIDDEIDLLVCGSGAAGMAAAIAAAHAGLRVLLAEKTNWFGGSTAISGGACWLPGHRHQQSIGLTDDRESVVHYLKQILGQRYHSELISAFLDRAPEMVDFFENNTQVKFRPRKSPDYHSDLEGAAWGRTIDPEPFDGRKLGAWFGALRWPLTEFMAFGGMMVGPLEIADLLKPLRSAASVANVLRLLSRYAMDRVVYPRGTRLVLGNALAARLLASAIDCGIKLLRNTTVRELQQDGGRVVAATLASGNRIVRVKVRRGVVLATGGIPNDLLWRSNVVPHARSHHSVAPDANVGDGVKLGMKAGGELAAGNANPVLMSPVSLMPRRDGSTAIFPHLVLDRQKPGVIAVNKAGRRFTNEANSYHLFVEAMYESDRSARTIPAFLISDSRALRKYGLGMARPGMRSHRKLIESGYLVAADSIEHLANKIDVDAANLAATIDAANAAALSGIDTEFGKGSTAYNRYLGDADNKPNPCLGSIQSPPFYAMRVWPGDIGTATGLRTDHHARVLNEAGDPIDGLYACGNDMNSIMAGHYPAGGITLGPALTFGYIAGRHAAMEAGL
jgi:succinate dehydrogenase/fumarate reductase flavoprotein subunit